MEFARPIRHWLAGDGVWAESAEAQERGDGDFIDAEGGRWLGDPLQSRDLQLADAQDRMLKVFNQP